MNKCKQKLISFAAAAAMLVSALSVQVGAYEEYTDSPQVESLPNRTAYYTLAEDTAENWSLSNNEHTTVSLQDGTLTFTNNSNSHYSIARNIVDASEKPNNGLVEIKFDVKFSNIDSDQSYVQILGNKIVANDSAYDSSILSIRTRNDEENIRLEDVNNVSNEQFSVPRTSTGNNRYTFNTISFHAL